MLIYSSTTRYSSSFAESVRFTPRWYLLPLLRVSKRWHAITVKYLYQTIAVGSHAPFQHPPRAEESVKYSLASGSQSQNWIRNGTSLFKRRKGHEIADDLYKTLSQNSSLAALITKLQLGIEGIKVRRLHHVWGSLAHVSYRRLQSNAPQGEPSWTQNHTLSILKLCPNVEQVNIRGFNPRKLGALIDVLGKKSLVYFSISSRNLSSGNCNEGKRVGLFSHILILMQKWPKLRGIRAEDFLDASESEKPVTLDASQVSECCPDLREIIITGAVLRPDMYRALRVMCSSGITKLAVSLHSHISGRIGDAAADALCECLRLWSPTLEYLKVDIVDNTTHVFWDPLGADDRYYQPLNEAMRTLEELRELRFDKMKLDLGVISRLPRLERLAYLPHYRWRKEETQNLFNHLEDTEKFPSLNLIVYDRVTIADGLMEVCRMREIQLAIHLKEEAYI